MLERRHCGRHLVRLQASRPEHFANRASLVLAVGALRHHYVADVGPLRSFLHSCILGLALFVELQFGGNRHKLQHVFARVVEQVVGRLALRASFHFVEGVVSDVVQLDGAVAEELIVLGEAGLLGGALLANDELLYHIGDLLLGLQAIEGLAHVAVLVLEGVEQVAVVLVAGIHDHLVELVVVDHHGQFEQLCLVHGGDLFDRDGRDPLDRAASSVHFRHAHFDAFCALKTLLDLLQSQVFLLALASHDYGHFGAARSWLLLFVCRVAEHGQ